ncbi:MAG: hypothetical protein FWC86_06735 [Coriobacteriia bacterium]|nr:hypothetical protein [Coriobacteriia bacterium]
MMSQRDIQIVKKLIDESDQVSSLIGTEVLEDFLLDEKTKRAVCMTLINIG